MLISSRSSDLPQPDHPRTGTSPSVRWWKRLAPDWPLTVVFLGFPLWWLLGVASVMFLATAVVMATLLWRRRHTLVAPRGFGLWLLFVAWVALGVLVLWADAPSAEVGGGDIGRVLVFGWRLAWYLSATIVLLYVGNLREEELPTRRMGWLMGYMFMVTTAGGLLGSFLPGLQLTSLMELLLPAGISEIGFIHTTIDPKISDVSDILGYEQSRPSAPFAYANTWGAAYAFFLPYFVLTWIVRTSGWRRAVGLAVLVASFWPAVYSLNRMLWFALGVMAVFVLVKLATIAGPRVLGLGLVVAVAVAAVAIFSPLSAQVQTRLDNPHSNDRRSGLASETVWSALTGSPLVGFGSTREVQGDLGTVSGGDRPGCDKCGSPPLGTQGHLWFMIFAHGLVAAVAFCAFFAFRFARHLKDRSVESVVGCSVLLGCSLFLFTYDLVEVPLYAVMISVALMWRASRRDVAVSLPFRR